MGLYQLDGFDGSCCRLVKGSFAAKPEVDVPGVGALAAIRGLDGNKTC